MKTESERKKEMLWRGGKNYKRNYYTARPLRSDIGKRKMSE